MQPFRIQVVHEASWRNTIFSTWNFQTTRIYFLVMNVLQYYESIDAVPRSWIPLLVILLLLL